MEKIDFKNIGGFIAKLAQNAGINIESQNLEGVIINYKLPDNRHQRVWIKRLFIDEKRGLVIIGIFSPALSMPTGQQLGQETANRLLRQNATFAQCAWAIDSGTDNNDYLVIMDTLIANFTQPEELIEAVESAAILADDMEKKLGQDVF